MMAELDLKRLLLPKIEQWRRLVNQTMSEAVYTRFHKRSGRLGAIRMDVDVTGEGDSATIAARVAGGPEYAKAQEEHREKKSRQGKGLYMVPLYSAYGNKPIQQADITAELSSGNVALLPGEPRVKGTNKWVGQSQWKNWLRDREGNKVKYFVRLPKSTPKAQFSQKKSRLGRSASGKEAGELLFAAYPEIIPGIPGSSRGRYSKPRSTKAPLVSKFGMKIDKDDSAVGAETMANHVPKLAETLWTPDVLDKVAEKMIKKLSGVRA